MPVGHARRVLALRRRISSLWSTIRNQTVNRNATLADRSVNQNLILAAARERAFPSKSQIRDDVGNLGTRHARCTEASSMRRTHFVPLAISGLLLVACGGSPFDGFSRTTEPA